MKKITMLLAPGFSKKTGYYFRCMRDRAFIEEMGGEVEFFHLNSILNILRALIHIMKNNRNTYLCENLATTLPIYLFSFIEPNIVKKSAVVHHGSLEELKLDKYGKLKEHVYKRFEKRFIRLGGKVLCVSNTMLEGLRDVYGEGCYYLSPNIPSKEFINSLDNNVELDIRIKLGVFGTKKLVCYCGNTQAWQKVDLLISLIKEKNKHSHFLILTSDVQYFTNELKGYENYFTAMSVENTEVPRYLQASDFLYLIRDNNETNHYACPTKAVEYIYSKTPIIISSQVGDISSFVSTHKNGLVISENEYEFPQLILEKIIAFKPIEEKISTPEVFTRKYQEKLYSKLFNL